MSSSPVSPQSRPVIVVGASLVGLSAALCLAAQKVPTVVLERHAGISKHPRAIGYTSRTMEIFKTLGIADQIPPVPEGFNLSRARVESLTGKWHETTSWTDSDKKKPASKEASHTSAPLEKIEYSPSPGAAMPQDQLEAILETTARDRGVDIRRQHTVVDLNQDDGGVTVTVVDNNGQKKQLQASYLIAADGNRSKIRELLRITRQGRGHMQTLRSVLFRADLDQYLQGVHQFNIEQPDLKAFMTTYNDGRWVLMFHDDIERDDATLLSAIHQAIGKSDIPIELITTGRWEMEALVADTFQSGRVFLAGDAAHTLPPNRGGYGANTGIADVHNLAWKIAAVLSGTSSPSLLETYDAERRPVALLRHDQIFARADFKVHLHKETPASEVIDDNAMELGQLYVSKGFTGVDDKLPAALKPDEWAGQPGTRMPHFRAVRDGESVSVLDTLDGVSWVLFSKAEEWKGVAEEVQKQSSSRIYGVQVGKDISPADGDIFQRAFGVTGTGASLVRPDGYIAWRTLHMPSDAVKVLRNAFAQAAMSSC